MSAARCIKLALLLSLIPLALRATSLLLCGGHGAPATVSSSSRQSWTAARHGGSSRATAAAAGVASAGPARDRDRDRDRDRQTYRHATHRRRRIAASDGGTRRLRQADGDWFEDDKRLAPTGSNPLHNLR